MIHKFKKEKRKMKECEIDILKQEVQAHCYFTIIIQGFFYILVLSIFGAMLSLGLEALLELMFGSGIDYLGNGLMYGFVFLGACLGFVIVKGNAKYFKAVKKAFSEDIDSGYVEEIIYPVNRFFKVTSKKLKNFCIYGIELSSDKVLFVDQIFLMDQNEKAVDMKNNLCISKSIRSEMILGMQTFGEKISPDLEAEVDHVYEYWFLECFDNGDIYEGSYQELRDELLNSCELCES